MFNSFEPILGSLLISDPFIQDPSFERSVIILCDRSAEGTVGLVLNHRSHLALSDIIQAKNTELFHLYIGGPVNTNALFFIHQIPHKIPGGTMIGESIYWGGDFELLVLLIENNQIDPSDIKFFLGYSGWSKNQLEDEITQNSWAVHQNFPTELAFVMDGDTLWKQALINLGPKYAHIANFPKNPQMN